MQWSYGNYEYRSSRHMQLILKSAYLMLRFHYHAINTAQKINWKPSSGRSEENEVL